MRIPTGTTDQYIYFVAVDPTDLKTRETGLSSFTVRRSRNGAASAAYTTPTINETDVTNMPGVYELLLDEDMTIDAGNKSEEVCLHITQASMAPVTRVFELYRPDVTEGETLTVASGIAQAAVQSIVANAIAAAAIATGALTASKFAAGAIDAAALAADAGTEIATAVWGSGTRVLTANTNLNDPTAAAIADAVWDEDATAHQTQGTFGQAIGDPVADTNTIYKAVVTDATGATVGVDVVAVKAQTAAIETDTAEIGAAGAGLTNINLPDQTMNITGDITGNLSGSAGSVTGAVGSVTGNVGGNVTGTIGGLTAAALKDFFDTDSATTYASAVAGSVVKEIADNAGGSALTAAAIADAVWDEAQADHVAAGSFGITASEIADILVDTGTTLQAELDGIQADTEDIQTRLPAALVSGRIDASVGAMAADTLTASALATDAREEIADQVWDEVLAGHAGAGSAGEALSAAGTAGDPWTTALPGAYGAGTAGKIVGDNINATISSRATQTSVDDLPTNAELATALGTADDAVLAQVALVKAKTDLIPAAPAAVGDIPTANQNADALLDRANAIETGLTPRQAMRLSAAADGGKLSGAATVTNTIRNAVADDKDRIVATVDADGNRTAITYDLT